jgi:hypothetical protein
MALASSGTMSIGGTTSTRSINLELVRAQNATSSMGESALRTLAGVSSGAISISNFYGKSNVPTLAFSNGNSISVKGDLSGTGDTAIFYLNTDGTFSYYIDNSGGTAPTAWLSPTTTNGSSSFEFKVITTVPTNCVLTVGRVNGSTTTRSAISSAWDSGWWDLNGYMGVVQLYNSSFSVNRTLSGGTLYIRNKTTLTEISRSFSMLAYAGI